MADRKIKIRSGKLEVWMEVTEEEYQNYYRPWWQQKKREQRNRESMEEQGYTEESYEAWRDNSVDDMGMYDTEGEWKADDVTKLKPGDIPYADIWTFGFPCQDISIAGKQRGLRGKRSGIYYSIIDLVKGKEEGDKPTYLLIENVKNLLSIHGGFDFAAVLTEMDEAGYDTRWQVLNSKDFGVPQNRERVFLIANLRSRGGRKILPVTGENGGTLKEVIGGMQGYRVYDPSGISVTLGANGGGMGAKTGLYCVGNVNPSGRGMNGSVYDARGLAPSVTTNKGEGAKVFIDQTLDSPKITEDARCLTARYSAGVTNHNACNSGVLEAHAFLTPDRLEKRQNGRRMKEAGEPMFTLTGQDRHGVYLCDKEEDGIPIRNAKAKEYRSSLGNEQLKKLWLEKTRSTSPREWSRKHLMPILCLVPDNEVQQARAAFGTLNKNHPDGTAIEKAKEYLEKASFYGLLEDQAALDRIFTETIIKGFAVMLTDVEEVKRYLDSRISTDPYDWFGLPEVDKKLQQMAEAKYNQGGSSKALEKIDNMDVEEVKRYLKELIKDNMTVGMEIIKGN